MKRTDKVGVHSDVMFIIDPAGHLTWANSDNQFSNWLD
jgi:hypothetical protein